MIPSFKHGIIASSRPRAAAAANDVTPNAVDWQIANLTSGDIQSNTKLTEEQITGINTTITLKLVNPSGQSWEMYYRVNNTALGEGCYDIGTLYYYTDVENNGIRVTIPAEDYITFTVSNNQYVSFAVLNYSDIEWEIRNASDGDALLGTMTWSTVPTCS